MLPTQGNIFVDDKLVSDHIESWYKKISYIDQSVALLDATLSENIALGQRSEEIDKKFLKMMFWKNHRQRNSWIICQKDMIHL